MGHKFISRHHVCARTHAHSAFSDSFTPRWNLTDPIHLPVCFWKVGANWRTTKLFAGCLKQEFSNFLLPRTFLTVKKMRTPSIQFCFAQFNYSNYLNLYNNIYYWLWHFFGTFYSQNTRLKLGLFISLFVYYFIGLWIKFKEPVKQANNFLKNQQ